MFSYALSLRISLDYPHLVSLIVSVNGFFIFLFYFCVLAIGSRLEELSDTHNPPRWYLPARDIHHTPRSQNTSSCLKSIHGLLLQAVSGLAGSGVMTSFCPLIRLGQKQCLVNPGFWVFFFFFLFSNMLLYNVMGWI
jgi:hypothetical protein